jgi:hypothetical protein
MCCVFRFVELCGERVTGRLALQTRPLGTYVLPLGSTRLGAQSGFVAGNANGKPSIRAVYTESSILATASSVFFVLGQRGRCFLCQLGRLCLLNHMGHCHHLERRVRRHQ